MRVASGSSYRGLPQSPTASPQPPTVSDFNPYHVWLGIPPDEQPANHYRLLGLNSFESNRDVIDSAADRQMAHLRTFQSGKHGALTQKILNEVAAARVCLLDNQKRAAYDAGLRTTLAAAANVSAASAASSASVETFRLQPGPARPAAPLDVWNDLIGDPHAGYHRSSAVRSARTRQIKLLIAAAALLIAAGAVLAWTMTNPPPPATASSTATSNSATKPPAPKQPATAPNAAPKPPATASESPVPSPQSPVPSPRRTAPSPQIVKLTELKPISAKVGWHKLLVNRAFLPHDIPMISPDPRPCDEYIYAHAASNLDYAVPAGMKYFRAVGYCVCRRDVRFEVRCDDKSLFKSDVAGIVPIAVELPAGARQLELVAEPVGQADAPARQSFWCRPRFYATSDPSSAMTKLTSLKPSWTNVGGPDFAINSVPTNRYPIVPPTDDTTPVLCDEYFFAHAASKLEFEIPEHAVSFSAIGYCDYRAGLWYRILADDTMLADSGQCGIAAFDVKLPEGAKVLTLKIDYFRTKSAAHTFWCYPRFHLAPK
jgi:hypothetical protein